ncbi:MAG TPA: ArsA family ATPase, partial [Actinomycetales bacterium]|nr:ArsA family ATPase [Actinomycetales bacterium]
MRVLLLTGKGGVGKTTTAAATAVHAARRGTKTLVLSTDGAHSLADALDTPLGQEPTEVEPGLFGQQVDPHARAERSWGGVRDYLLQVLEVIGTDPLVGEDLTLLPGAEEVLALLEVRDQVQGGLWDLVVVDCAPTAETLRLLALPEVLTRCLDRLLPADRRILRALRPLARTGSGTGGLPMPGDPVVEAAQRLTRELAEVRQVLTAPATSARVVLTPEQVVVAEARRTVTALTLHGYAVDAVIANRVVPPGEDPWRSAWARAQSGVLASVEADFAPLPVLTA